LEKNPSSRESPNLLKFLSDAGIEAEHVHLLLQAREREGEMTARLGGSPKSGRFVHFIFSCRLSRLVSVVVRTLFSLASPARLLGA